MTSPATGIGARTHRPDIDGLRAIAILAVALNHAGIPHLSGGFTGVDIFFVISGFLIGGQIHSGLRDGTFTFSRFYQRRARRILPAFFAVLVITLAIALLLLAPAELTGFARSSLAASVSASNILFWGTSNYFASRSGLDPMLMTWSLGVEEQFYLLIPLLLLLLARIRRGVILPAILIVCILSFGLSWALLPTHPMLVFYLLPARAWELGSGAALAIAQQTLAPRASAPFRSNFLGSVGLALLLAPILLLNPAAPFPGPAALPSVLGTALCIAAPASFANRRILSLQPLVFVGKVSYSFYLWHWPLLAFLRILYGGNAPQPLPIAVVAFSFLMAVATYRAVEQPFRCSRRAPLPTFIRYAAALAAAAGLCVILWLNRGLPQRFPALAAAEKSAEALKTDPCLAGYGVDRPSLSTTCIQRAAQSQVVWGDSHSAALAPGLRANAFAHNAGFIQFGKAACAPLLGATHFSPRIPRLAAECAQFNLHVFDLIRVDSNIHTVLLNADWAGYLYTTWQDGWLTSSDSIDPNSPDPQATRTLFVQSLASTIQTLQSAGKHVIVLNDIPTFDTDPLWRMRTQSIPARHGLAGLLHIPNAADPGSSPPSADAHTAVARTLLAAAVAQSPGAQLIDPAPALCTTSGECAYRNAQTLFYTDSNHLSTAGSLFVAEHLDLQELPANVRVHAPLSASPPGQLRASATGAR